MSVHNIAQQLEGGIKFAFYGQKLVGLAYISHLYQVVESQILGTAGKTYFADAPYVVGNRHVALDQLDAFGLGGEADFVLAVVGRSPDTVEPVDIVFLGICRQGRQQLVVEQG